MTFPTGRATDDAETIAAQIDGQLSRTLARLTAWRSTIEATSMVDSLEAQDRYQSIAASVVLVDAKKDTTGLAETYQRRFPAIGAADLASEWIAARTAMVAFLTWMQGNWPERTGTNKPAFLEFGPTGELRKFTISLPAPARTSLLARIDAVLAAFS